MKKYIYFFSIGLFSILFCIFVVLHLRSSRNEPMPSLNSSQTRFSLQNKIIIVKKINGYNDLFLFNPQSPKTTKRITNTDEFDEQKAIVSNDYKTIFYSAVSRDIFSIIRWDIAKNLQETLVVSEYPVNKITCSPDGRQILYEIQKNESQVQWYYIDSKTKRTSALPSATVYTVWINDQQIILETNEENIEIINIEKNAVLGESKIILEKAKNPIILGNSLITLQFIENNWRFVQTDLRGEEQIVFSPFIGESVESIPYDLQPLGDHRIVFKRAQGLWIYDFETSDLKKIDGNVNKILITPDNLIVAEKSVANINTFIRYVSPLYAADPLGSTEYSLSL